MVALVVYVMESSGDNLVTKRVKLHGPGGWSGSVYRIFRSSQSPRPGRHQPVATIDRHLGAWRLRTNAGECLVFPTYAEARREVWRYVLIGT